MDNIFLIFIVLVFLAVVLFIEGSFLTWNAYRGPEAQRIERRLRAMSAGSSGGSAALLKKRLLSNAPTLDRLLLEVPRIHRVDRLLEQSGSSLTVAGFLGLSLLAATLIGIIGLLIELPVPVVLLAAAGAGLLPLAHVSSLRRQRLLKIEEQFPDALDLMSRALRAGHAFPSALQMVGNEGPEPIASEFRTTFDEINFGVSVQDALANLATRVPSTDVRYFVIAVLIQRETGGNLTELLGNIAGLIRDRLRIRGTVRVLSAEGRLSAWILTLLPIALALVLQLVNPKFLAVLWTDRMGWNLLVAALVLMVIGIFWMWRIIKIRI